LVGAGPFVVRAGLKLRGTFELLVGNVHLEAAELLVVVEACPRNGIVFVAEAEETAEGHDGVGHLPRIFVDHDAFDRADLIAVRAIDVGADHLVAADEVVGLAALVAAGYLCCAAHPVLHPLAPDGNVPRCAPVPGTSCSAPRCRYDRNHWSVSCRAETNRATPTSRSA